MLPDVVSRTPTAKPESRYARRVTLTTTQATPVRRRLVIAGLVFAAALMALVAVLIQRNSSKPIDLGAGASISCTPQVVTYGSPVSCDVSATVASEVVWGDGGIGQARDGIDHVGLVSVQLISDIDTVIAATEVNVEPDLRLDCETDTWKNVYEFVASDEHPNGWDYVYLDPVSGGKILPGHPVYPSDPGLTDLELVVLDRVQETGECTASSAASDAFDGDITFTMGSIWEEHSVPFPRLTPWSDHHWKGTQPGFIDVSVTVNDTTVSERRSIYFSGCT